MRERLVEVSENEDRPFGQTVKAGRHVFTADEPVAVGGGDHGPDPFALVLAGLGACTSMTIRMYAERKGWPLDHVAVSVHLAIRAGEGVAEDEVIERTVTLTGDLDPAQRERLLEIAGMCPVSRLLARGVPMKTVAVAGAPE